MRKGVIVSETCHKEDEQNSMNHWDARELGIAGLKGRAGPLGWPAVIFLIFLFTLVGVNIESLEVEDMAKLAIAPLTVLLAVAGLPFLKFIAKYVDQADSTDTNPIKQATSLEKLSMLISIVTTLPVISILVYVLLPIGQARDIAGSTSVCLIVLQPIVLLRIRSIIAFIDNLGSSSDPIPPLPRKAHRWAWIVDLLSSGLVVLPLTLLLALGIRPLTTTIWVLWTSITGVYFGYQVLAIVIWGRTLVVCR